MMPRKPTQQPEPISKFTLSDGTPVEVRDHSTREIGRGLDKKSLAEELDWQVLTGLFDDLLNGDTGRVDRAGKALSSNHAMARFLQEADYALEERTGRRHGKSIRAKYKQLRQIVGIVEYDSWLIQEVRSAPCTQE